jgi:hypothetical protein
MKERIRKTPQEIGLDRVFVPGRLRHQWLAAAYERLVPIHRRLGRQEPQENPQPIPEEYRWVG